MVEETKFLEDDANASPQRGQRLARRIHGVFTEQHEASAGRAMGKIDHLQQRRFAGAGRTGEKPELAFVQGQADIAQRFGCVLIGEAGVLETNNFLCGFQGVSSQSWRFSSQRPRMSDESINDSGPL